MKKIIKYTNKGSKPKAISIDELHSTRIVGPQKELYIEVNVEENEILSFQDYNGYVILEKISAKDGDGKYVYKRKK